MSSAAEQESTPCEEIRVKIFSLEAQAPTISTVGTEKIRCSATRDLGAQWRNGSDFLGGGSGIDECISGEQETYCEV